METLYKKTVTTKPDGTTTTELYLNPVVYLVIVIMAICVIIAFW